MNDHYDKTARCILVGPEGYLLVKHSNCSAQNLGKWGLPGGRLELGEAARATLRRELMEELFIDIEEFVAVGRYRYKDCWHRVFAAEYEGGIERWDEAEIAAARWHSLSEIESAEVAGQLHTGFEASAIRDLESHAHSITGPQ